MKTSTWKVVAGISTSVVLALGLSVGFIWVYQMGQQSAESSTPATPSTLAVKYNPSHCKAAYASRNPQNYWTCVEGGVDFRDAYAIPITDDNRYRMLGEGFENLMPPYTTDATGIMYTKGNRVLYPVTTDEGFKLWVLVDNLQLDPQGIYISSDDLLSVSRWNSKGWASGYAPSKLWVGNKLMIGFSNNLLPKNELSKIDKEH